MLLLENLKKMFVAIAYVAYAVSTILKNQMQLNLGYYEYIFVVIIGVCLKLSQHTEVIEKILHEIPTDELEFIKNRLDSIVEMSIRSQSEPPSIQQRNIVNVPYADNDDAKTDVSQIDNITHRSIELSNGNILRIHN